MHVLSLLALAALTSLDTLNGRQDARAEAQVPDSSIGFIDLRSGQAGVVGGSSDALRWTATNPDAWRLGAAPHGAQLELGEPDVAYAPQVRSPQRFALVDRAAFGDFDLTVEAQQTSREYGHRDLCVVFGFQDAEHFYYAHFATTPDENACNVFLVDGAPRRRLAEIPANGVDWGAVEGLAERPPWRRLRVRRDGDRLRTWFEGALVVDVRDATLGAGLVGLGSFDDTGRFRDLVVTGSVGAPITSPFAHFTAAHVDASGDAWPQGPGPRGDWSTTGPPPPLEFSVRTGTNIRWRAPLPAAGQGGLAVSGDRVYLATMAPWDADAARAPEEVARFKHATEGRQVVGKDIDAHCLDARTGEVLWTRRLSGSVPAIHAYPFSDATSASPVTDGAHVWFTNAAGRVACFMADGALVWERAYTPTFDGPFNKQFEPFLVRDGARQVLVHMEPFPAPGADAADLAGRWHHLLGLDAATGEVLWRSADALTHYNAPTLVTTDEGVCVLIARGGPHDVPERPVGVSLVRATGPRAGSSVWRFEDPRGNHEAALHTLAHDERFVYWVLRDPASAIVALDLATGTEVASVSLTRSVTRSTFDRSAGTWAREVGVDLDQGVFPARYSVLAANGYVYFQCYATAFGKPTLAPLYSFGRAHLGDGTVEYLEVPTDVTRDEGGAARFLWRTPRAAQALDHRGVEVTGDERSRWDGWDWVFNGSPTRVNDRLYYTLASGVVYVLDARTARFDGEALLAVNDLGPAGGVWSANSVSYAGGRLFHRTSAEALCIGYPVD